MSLATMSGVGIRSRLATSTPQISQWTCRVANADRLVVRGSGVGVVQKRDISIQALDERKGGMWLPQRLLAV